MKIIFRKYDLESGGDILPLLPIAVATGEENCCIPEAVKVVGGRNHLWWL
jgi:hypothetical protein